MVEIPPEVIEQMSQFHEALDKVPVGICTRRSGMGEWS